MKNLITFASLIVFAVVYRVLSAEMVEDGGDALGHWSRHRFAGPLEYFNLLEYNHHSARFGVELPTNLVLDFVGSGVIGYYAPAFVFFLIQLGIVFLIAQREKSTCLTISACLLLIMHPLMLRLAVHPLPGVFSGTYAIASLLFIQKFQDKDFETKNLVFASILFFLAYGSKVTNLFILPGFAIVLYFLRRRFKDLFVYFGILLALFLIEWAVYAFFADMPYGRLSAISKHLGKKLTTGYEFWELFNRYSIHLLGPGMAYSIYASLIVCPYIFLRDRTVKSVRVKVALGFLTFVLISVFAVKSIDPLLPAERMLRRYLGVLMPFTSLLMAYGVYDLLQLIANFFGRFAKKARPAFGVAATVVSFLLLLYPLYISQLENNKNKYSYFGGDRNPVSLLWEYESLAEKALESNLQLYFQDYKACKTYAVLFNTPFAWTCRDALQFKEEYLTLISPEYESQKVPKLQIDESLKIKDYSDSELPPGSVLWVSRRPFKVQLASVE